MNEDFVTYELAVKLKEKGFDELCTYAYCEQGGWNKYRQVHEPITYILRTDGNPFGSFYCGKNWNIKYETNKNKICCSAPTISQVLKWLRKEKLILIGLSPMQEYDGDEVVEWCSTVYKADKQGGLSWKEEFYYQSYELAALAGVNYCLDNLI